MVRLLAWVAPVGYLAAAKVGAALDVNGDSAVGFDVSPLQ